MILFNSKRGNSYIRFISMFIILILLSSSLPNNTGKIYAKTKYDGIETSYKLVIMKPGDTYELDADKYYYATYSGKTTAYYDDCKAAWQSSDTSVATINSNGKLTAKSSGKCIITATWGGKKATCKVRVYNNEELYEQMLDAKMADDIIYLALKTNDYDLIYGYNMNEKDAEMEIKAAKKTREILDQVVKEDMSDFQKIMEIANWMEKNIRVDNSFESKFAQSLSVYDNKRYYIDGLLYGKVREEGFGILFELLLNSCGIRCEWIKEENSEFNTDDNNTENAYGSNTVQLEGNWYYFNICALGDNVFYNDNAENKCIYDRIIYSDKFLHLKTNKFFEESINKKLDERSSFYNSISMNYHYFNALDVNVDRKAKYEYSYYDFYTQSIRFVTLKEVQKKGIDKICLEPKFVTFASYPDSTCDKYKKIMDDEINMIRDVLDFEDEVNRVYLSKDTYYSVNNNIFQELNQKMIELKAKYETVKNTLVDRNAVEYLDKKVAKIQDKLSRMK